MTALLYSLEPEKVRLAMDTLACHRLNKSPLRFSSKIFPLPFLGGVMCGTGLNSLVIDWWVFINSRVIAKEMNYLNEVAPNTLPTLFNQYRDANCTATIYHFGFNSEENGFSGFAFRSEKGFVAEKLCYGIGVKPAYPGLQMGEVLSTILHKGFSDGCVEIIKKMAEFDSQEPLGERIGIGGEVEFFHLEREGMLYSTRYRFENYGLLYNEMLENLRKENEEGEQAKSSSQFTP